MTGLRVARPGDAGAIAAIYAPHVIQGVASFELEAPDAAEMARRIAASAGVYPWLVAVADDNDDDDDGDVLAYAYASAFRAREAYRWAVETTIYVAATAHRRGIGRQLYGALIATLRAQGFTQAVGAISLPNAASVALHEALGFRHAGTYRAIGWKHGRAIDVGLWQCALAEAGPRRTPSRIPHPPSRAGSPMSDWCDSECAACRSRLPRAGLASLVVHPAGRRGERRHVHLPRRPR